MQRSQILVTYMLLFQSNSTIKIHFEKKKQMHLLGMAFPSASTSSSVISTEIPNCYLCVKRIIFEEVKHIPLLHLPDPLPYRCNQKGKGRYVQHLHFWKSSCPIPLLLPFSSRPIPIHLKAFVLSSCIYRSQREWAGWQGNTCWWQCWQNVPKVVKKRAYQWSHMELKNIPLQIQNESNCWEELKDPLPLEQLQLLQYHFV